MVRGCDCVFLVEGGGSFEGIGRGMINAAKAVFFFLSRGGLNGGFPGFPAPFWSDEGLWFAFYANSFFFTLMN